MATTLTDVMGEALAAEEWFVDARTHKPYEVIRVYRGAKTPGMEIKYRGETNSQVVDMAEHFNDVTAQERDPQLTGRAKALLAS
jgi:hypothetical protein